MKKNARNPKPSQKTMKVSAQRKKSQDPRWSFNLKPTKWGPFETQGASIDSRSIRSMDRSMVGLGSRAIDIQRKMPRLQTTTSENGNVVDLLTGTDLLSTLSAPSAGAVSGDILFSQKISPSLFANSRLLQFSRLYQRYRFRRIQFLYEPVANATQSGQLLGFADFDVDNILSVNSPSNLNIGAAHQGQSITQIWQPRAFDMGQLFTFTDLYTEQGQVSTSDPRMSIQGVFYILAASGLTALLPLGNIYVDYEIEFSIPFLSTAESVASRYSFGAIKGQYHQFADGAMQVQSVTPQGAFGPVTADYTGISSSTIEWQGTQSGDVITVFLWNLPFATTQNSTASTTGLPTLAITGGSLTVQYYLDVAHVAGELQWGFFAQITCAPVSGFTTLSMTSPLSVEINSPSNSSVWTWTMEPAPMAFASRFRSLPQLEVDALKKQLAELSDLVHGYTPLSKNFHQSDRQSAEMRLPSSQPAPSVVRKASHELEFTQLSTRPVVRPCAKVSDLSDSDEEDVRDYLLVNKASSDVSRPLRRAGP